MGKLIYLAIDAEDQAFGIIYSQSRIKAQEFLDQDLGGRAVSLLRATISQQSESKALPVIHGAYGKAGRPVEGYRVGALRALTKEQYDYIVGDGRGGQSDQIRAAIQFYLDHNRE